MKEKIFFKIWYHIALIAGSALSTLIYIILINFVSIQETIINHKYFLIWLGIFALPLPLSIINLIYLIRLRKKKKYVNFDTFLPTKEKHIIASERIDVGDEFFFKVLFNKPVEDEVPFFVDKVNVTGPYCASCKSDLTPLIDKITKKAKGYSCTYCNEEYSI